MSRTRLSEFEVKQKPSGIYFVEFYEGEGGDQIRRRESCETRDRKEAYRRAPLIISGDYVPQRKARAASKADPVSGAITMAQLFDRCLDTIWSPRAIRSVATNRSNVRVLLPYIGSELISEITYSRLERLVDELFENRFGSTPYAPGSVDRLMNTVSAALTQATKETDANRRPWIVGKPAMPSLVADNFKDRIVSDVEEAAMFAAIAKRAESEPGRDWDRFGRLIRFLLDTGARLGEALALTVDRVEFDGEHTYALFPRYSTKNKKPREIPLSDDIVAFVPALRASAEKGRLFPMDANTVWRMLQAIKADVATAGHDMEDVTLHTMRHSCLTRLAKSRQVSLADISEWAGHSSIQITKDRYIHLMRDQKVPVLAVINGLKRPVAQAA